MQIHTNVLAAFGLVLAVSPVSAQQVQHKHTKAELAQADLWMAMISGKLASVKAALDGGADPNKPEAIELTPLAFARDIPTVKLLLSRGAKINGGTIRGSALTNALLVGNEPVATFLLDHGAKPNNSRVSRNSPSGRKRSTGNQQMSPDGAHVRPANEQLSLPAPAQRTSGASSLVAIISPAARKHQIKSWCRWKGSSGFGGIP